ncbi:uncharacterized protein [Diadema antillarum]|uniref:uncharacterized protein n=1 Tax=Diadema antillarum TaxID=105358 RepID=UPI003A870815
MDIESLDVEETSEACSPPESDLPNTQHGDFSPPVNDFQDELLDELLHDLQSSVQVEQREDLADDAIDDPLLVIADEIAHVIEDECQQSYTCNENNCDDEDPPLYPGSTRHLGVTVLLLCCFMIRFRLSEETMQHLLVLINLLLPENNIFVKSLHTLKKYLGKFTFLPVIQYFCSHCYTHVDKSSQRCSNPHCMKDLTSSGAVSYFVQHSLISQLSVLFKRKSFTDKIRTHRFEHYKLNKDGNLCDVYDGSIYKNLFQGGILNSPNNISFAMNTDGVSIFKSSKVSMWPVYLLINELPLSDRKARENTLFYGVWISARKPVMWSFLKPLYNDLVQLENGVTFEDYNGDKFTSHAVLLTCTCDLPAKSLVCNSLQFNGNYGCWHCLQRGHTFRTLSGGNVHVFPYNECDPCGPARTLDSIKSDVDTAVGKIKNGEKDYVENGIKGPSWLMFLSHFNFAHGFVIDCMHGLYGGVTKLLLKCWFSHENRHEKFSFFSSRQKVSELLSHIKPTINVTRVPRGLDDLAFWKASEYRNFLLYWGIPVLRHILSAAYFAHFCCLVKATFLLSKEMITPGDILQAEACIKQFVGSFAELYSERYMTMNVHQVLHLVNTVLKTGPLFANNCFVFEDLNGYIVSQIHGTQGIDTQIISTINLIQAIPILKEKYEAADEEASAFIESISRHHMYHKCWNFIQTGFFRIDQLKDYVLSPEDLDAIKRTFNISCSSLKIWSKIYVKSSSSYVYASCYQRLVRRNQSIIKYVQDRSCTFGSVKLFTMLETPTGEVSVAVVKPFHLMEMYNERDHIHCVKNSCDEAEVHVIPIGDIIGSCMYIQIEEDHFVCEVANRYDKD